MHTTTDELQSCAVSTAQCSITNYVGVDEDTDVRRMTTDTARDLLTIDSSEKLGWLNFIIAGLSFPIYPHILIRYYVAKDVRTLKTGMQVLHLSPLIAALPSITLGVALIHYGLELEDSTAVFGTAMTELVGENTFYYFMASAILAAAVAAYMSTADSGLLAISSIVTLDFVQPYCWCSEPWNEQDLLKVGKAASIVSAAVGVCMVPWDITLSDLFVLQGTLLFQALPTFVLGLYWKRASARGMVLAMSAGIITLFLNFVLALAGITFFDVSAAVWSFLAQCFVIGVYYYVLQLDKDVWDPLDRPEFGKFGMFHKSYCGLDISDAGGPVEEPCRPLWMNAVSLGLCFLSIPFWWNTSYEKSHNHYVRGFPSWGIIVLILNLIGILLSMYQTEFRWGDALSSPADGYQTLGATFLDSAGSKSNYSKMADKEEEPVVEWGVMSGSSQARLSDL